MLGLHQYDASSECAQVSIKVIEDACAEGGGGKEGTASVSSVHDAAKNEVAGWSWHWPDRSKRIVCYFWFGTGQCRKPIFSLV